MRARSPARPATASRLSRIGERALARWKAFDASTPFQHPQWYQAWYSAFAGHAEPLIAIVSDAATGEPAVLLPLIRRRQNGIRIVEFADLDLTDYNAPLLGRAAPRDARAARGLWRDLLSGAAPDVRRRRSHPSPQDRRSISTAGPIRWRCSRSAGPCSLNGNVVTTGEDYDAWRYTLERTVRKELERSWRVFTRDPAAAFRLVTDKDEALRILLDHRGPAGRADAKPRAELHPQRRDLRGVLPQSGPRRRRPAATPWCRR